MNEKYYEIAIFVFIECIPLFLFFIFGLVTWRYYSQIKRLEASEDGEAFGPIAIKSLKRRFIIFSALLLGILYFMFVRLIVNAPNKMIAEDFPEMGWRFWLFIQGIMYSTLFIVFFGTIFIIYLLHTRFFAQGVMEENLASLRAHANEAREAAETEVQ